MAAQIRTKNRIFEPCKRVITPELFEELLEARKFAVARSAAKAHLKSIEEQHLQSTQPRGPAADTASSQDSEYRHHETHKANPLLEDRDGNGAAAAMDIDEPEFAEARLQKKQLKVAMKRQRAEAERLMQEAEKAEKEAERKLQWAAAEEKRFSRITEVERLKHEEAASVESAKASLEALKLEMEPLNEQKAKLVAQLKQVLQGEEALRRASAASNLEEGETLPSPQRNPSGAGISMDTSS